MVKLRSLLCQTLDNFGSISWTHLRYFKIIYVFVVETPRRIRRICLVTFGDEKLGVSTCCNRSERPVKASAIRENVPGSGATCGSTQSENSQF